MLKLLWFISRPEQDIEGFEDWYQNEHVPVGMRQERLQRFRINRSFYPQPDFVVRLTGLKEPRAYRFSEGYWNTLEDIRACYVSVHGRAALADGALNIPGPRTPPKPQPVLVVREEPLQVGRALCFDIQTGLYQSDQACKLFGFIRLPAGAGSGFDEAYRALAREVADHPQLRGHVLGFALDEVIRPGRVMRWPPEGAERFDRTLEFYFESPRDLQEFASGGWMQRAVALVGEHAEAHTWDATQIQEVFYTSLGRQPLEDSWKALYAH